MPEIIETTVYRLGELSDAAKDKARAWYREGGFDYDWYDAVYEDFQRIAEILGLNLKTRTVRLMDGGTRQEPCIWFRGFWSQGDGACFESLYSYRKQAPHLIRAFAIPLKQDQAQRVGVAEKGLLVGAQHRIGGAKNDGQRPRRGGGSHDACLAVMSGEGSWSRLLRENPRPRAKP